MSVSTQNTVAQQLKHRLLTAVDQSTFQVSMKGPSIEIFKKNFCHFFNPNLIFFFHLDLPQIRPGRCSHRTRTHSNHQRGNLFIR